jgi:hypothetical protein
VGSVLSNPEEIVDLDAVIIGYDGGRGILLVKHRSSPSIEATVDSYLRNPGARNHWFASFKWAMVNKADRAEIESLYKAVARTPRAKDKKAKGLGRLLVGMTALCTLKRDPKWQATYLSIDFDATRFDIPATRVKTSPSPVGEPDCPNRFTERLRGIRASGETNIRKPWRG